MSNNKNLKLSSENSDGLIVKTRQTDSLSSNLPVEKLISIKNTPNEQNEKCQIKYTPKHQTIDNVSYRYFSESTEAIQYAEEKWKAFWDMLPEELKSIVCSYEVCGRRMDSKLDRYVINAAKKVINTIPPFDENVILYRGGKDEDFNGDRPFLASSFLKDTAEHFAERCNGNIYIILVHQGAKAIPLCGQGDLGFTMEQEVLIKTVNLHRKGNVFEYYDPFEK